MIGYLVAGLLAGFSVGFVGAGAAVIGLPFLLYVDRMAPSTALGTNALGVALTAGIVLLYRLRRKRVSVAAGVSFSLPGVVGVSAGTLLARLLPGAKIVFLLGFVLFAVAGWMFYLSGQRTDREPAPCANGDSDEEHEDARRPDSADGSPDSGPEVGRGTLLRLGAWGAAVGVACGFFAVGGGFIIIPTIMLAAGFTLIDAIATGLLPFAVFSLWIGVEYWLAGSALVLPALVIAGAGFVGGVGGIGLARRLSRVTMQRVFGVLMVGLGIYMILR